ncbi:hypothetical protein OBBRIDRAFT_295281 [Obba rivulosa]|uniref:Uncharacterized protein n=1 Tax=Obba rivulosa TaxID=1052685 RepID=A0A8E2DKB9_9APHY|nr:hypothetical protein OBBRIDRAFT_295281 [Obba rivulosa]
MSSVLSDSSCLFGTTCLSIPVTSKTRTSSVVITDKTSSADASSLPSMMYLCTIIDILIAPHDFFVLFVTRWACGCHQRKRHVIAFAMDIPSSRKRYCANSCAMCQTMRHTTTLVGMLLTKFICERR